MSPITKLLGMLAKKAGKGMGGVVQKDHASATAYLKEQGFKPFKDAFESPLHKDIHDLVTTDHNVSASWIIKLMNQTKDMELLKSIHTYIIDPIKTSNISPASKKALINKSAKKMQEIRDSELFNQFMDTLRNHGDDLF